MSASGWLCRTSLFAVVGACGITQRTVQEGEPAAGHGGAGPQSGMGMITAGVVGVTTGGATSATGGGRASGGFASGKAGGTTGPAAGAPTMMCNTACLQFEPTCEAPPEPDPSWCVESLAGAGGEAPGQQRYDLLDDLEDGDAVTPFVLNGRGAWYSSNDGTGQQFPAPCAVPSLLPQHEATPQNLYGMRTFGAFFSTLPGGFSNIGVALRSGENGCAEPVDASAYGGVRFVMHGSPGFVRFSVTTVATAPTTHFGTCEQQCWDTHGVVLEVTEGPLTYHVGFDTLAQEGWGTPAVFQRSQILGVQWSAKADPAGGGNGAFGPGPPPASCFDFWIDDVVFDDVVFEP